MTAEFIESRLLVPFRHGFFTRKGGNSKGFYQGLNCGRSTADDPENVRQNRVLAAQAIGVKPGSLFTVRQIHSADAVTVNGHASTAGIAADAMVTAESGVALGIVTADCQPVLFADPGAGVVGAAHAGWRGALSGVLDSTVRAMESLGAQRDGIRAVIGPSISQANYEVGPELYAEFVAKDPGHHEYFVPGNGDRLMFDLPGLGLALLDRAGLKHVEWTGHCTYRDPDRFFSCRRSHHAKEPGFGLMISIISA